jgi:hypothetical protein
VTTLEQCDRHVTQHEARFARATRCSSSMAGCQQPNPTRPRYTQVIAMEQNAQAQAKPIKIPGPEHPISVEHNSSRVVVSVAGRIIADTREALTVDEAHYPAVQYIPRKDVDMAQLTRSAADPSMPSWKTAQGHEERFPSPRLSGRCRFRKRWVVVDDYADVAFWVRL